MTANVIAGEELLDSSKEGLLMVLVDEFVHTAVAAGIFKASIRVEIDVTDRITHPET